MATKTPYARLAAAVFDIACEKTGLSNLELAERLPTLLGREKLNRLTIGQWRSGETPVRLDALLALAHEVDSSVTSLTLEAVRRDPSLLGVAPARIVTREVIKDLVELQAHVDAARRWDRLERAFSDSDLVEPGS